LRAPATASLLTERRLQAPYGLHGGSPGEPGCNTLQRSGGEIEAIGGKGTWELAAGDAITLETPGGGGWEKAE
jgi:5-oxoprolinase (ATP-hydrolysing)